MGALVFAFMSTTLSVAGATQIVIPDARVCEACATLEPAAELRDPDGRAYLSSPQSVALLSDGTALVVSSVDQSGFAVFGPDGKFRRRVGVGGEGPGEYNAILSLWVDSEDSVYVWDPGNVRMTVLGPSLEYRRDIPFRYPMGRAIPSGDGFVGSGIIRNTSLAGYPLHIVGGDGSLSESFGAEAQGYRQDRSNIYRRSITVQPDGGIWSGRFLEYALEKWDRSGNRLMEVTRETDWFPRGTYFGAPPGDPAGEPSPGLVHISAPANGRIWTVSWVAGRNWKDAIGTIRLQGRARVGVPRENRELYWDTVVELLDISEGRVLAQTRIDALVLGFADARHVFTYREESDGEPVIVLYRLRYTPTPDGGSNDR